MKFEAILFDFDGVLIESEAAGNRHLATCLTAMGHPISAAAAMERFMGLAGKDFLATVERWIGRPLPADFHAARAAEDARALRDGVDAVAGAVAFVRGLPVNLPRAVTSSSSTLWIERHLDHIGLGDAFAGRIFSGREHVARGKPAPDLYLYAARALGARIERTVIIEDSPVGATGAVAAGGYVIGFSGASHCPADHADRLAALGVDLVVRDFDAIARAIGIRGAFD